MVFIVVPAGLSLRLRAAPAKYFTKSRLFGDF